jgi:hypothetical protein
MWDQEDKADKNQWQPHSDHQKNVTWVKVYIKKMEANMPKGMRIRVCDSSTDKETMVQVTYQPDFGVPKGAYGAIIELHKPHERGIDTRIVCFLDEFHSAVKEIQRIATRGEEKAWF